MIGGVIVTFDEVMTIAKDKGYRLVSGSFDMFGYVLVFMNASGDMVSSVDIACGRD